jgi:hypothetical protein
MGCLLNNLFLREGLYNQTRLFGYWIDRKE